MVRIYSQEREWKAIPKNWTYDPLSKMLFAEKRVPCPYPYPNPDEMWSKSIFRGLLFYRINLRIMQIELKMVVVIVDKVLFDKASHTAKT